MHITQQQATAYTGRTERTLAAWVADGLPYGRQPHCRQRIFRTADLDQWQALMQERSRTGKGRPKGSKNHAHTRGDR